MKKPTTLLLASLALLGPLATGCGGGDDAPSKKEFASDLDAICRETNSKVAKLKAPQTLKELPRFTRDSRKVVDESLDKAEALELPKEDRSQFKDYIADSRDSIDSLDDLEQAARKNDQKAVRRILVKAAEDNNRRDAQAKALGLKDCGNTSGS